MERKRIINLILLASLALSCQSAFGQGEGRGVNIIALLANPEKFDGKVVSVLGFLTIDHQKSHAAIGFLFLHEEDAKHLLSNGLQVVPSEQMIRDEEKIDRMYVIVTGTLRAVPGTGDSHALVMKDVKSCRVWSDPKRPVGLGEGK
ncbi:MAG TPA: hypothetical protein VE377_02945 [Candidatus Dormibacteraeota bacterium]|nr:hypothetical protein [Candidatus Dormibacteraeota bacterium]